MRPERWRSNSMESRVGNRASLVSNNPNRYEGSFDVTTTSASHYWACSFCGSARNHRLHRHYLRTQLGTFRDSDSGQSLLPGPRKNWNSTSTSVTNGCRSSDRSPPVVRPSPWIHPVTTKSCRPWRRLVRFAVAFHCSSSVSATMCRSSKRRSRTTSIHRDSFPLIGMASLHHAHYKCTIYFTERTINGWPVPYTLGRQRSG